MIERKANVHTLDTVLETAIAHTVEQLGTCEVAVCGRRRAQVEDLPRARTHREACTCTKPTTPSLASSATSISSARSVIGTTEESDFVSACHRRRRVACGTGLSGVICAPWRSSSVASRYSCSMRARSRNDAERMIERRCPPGRRRAFEEELMEARIRRSSRGGSRVRGADPARPPPHYRQRWR